VTVLKLSWQTLRSYSSEISRLRRSRVRLVKSKIEVDLIRKKSRGVSGGECITETNSCSPLFFLTFPFHPRGLVVHASRPRNTCCLLSLLSLEKRARERVWVSAQYADRVLDAR
jgi:hypothetical protein